MNKKRNEEELAREAEAHWEYTVGVIEEMGGLTKFLYKESFKHGYKHGWDECEREAKNRDILCPDCGGCVEIRNPTGRCDHLCYPTLKKKKNESIKE